MHLLAKHLHFHAKVKHFPEKLFIWCYTFYMVLYIYIIYILTVYIFYILFYILYSYSIRHKMESKDFCAGTCIGESIAWTVQIDSTDSPEGQSQIMLNIKITIAITILAFTPTDENFHFYLSVWCSFVVSCFKCSLFKVWLIPKILFLCSCWVELFSHKIRMIIKSYIF